MSAPIPNDSSYTGRNVCFLSAPSYGVPASPALTYAYSEGIKIGGQTGNWAPIQLNNQGALKVDIGLPSINVSGDVNIGAAVSISGGYIGITGQPVLEAIAIMSNRLLSGISGLQLGTYTRTAQVLTASQAVIPVGALSWTVSIQSGNGVIDGISFPAGYVEAGGGYGGRRLATQIAAGITGGRMLVIYES